MFTQTPSHSLTDFDLAGFLVRGYRGLAGALSILRASGGITRLLTNVWVRSVAVLGLVFYPVVASATTETFMGTFDLTPAEATFLVTNTNGTASMPAAGNSGPTTDSTTQPPHLPLTFELFNPSLGTLNSVTISFTSSPSATTLSISATNK